MSFTRRDSFRSILPNKQLNVMSTLLLYIFWLPTVGRCSQNYDFTATLGETI